MDEGAFRNSVLPWCKQLVKDWKKKAKLNPDSMDAFSEKLVTGWIPYHSTKTGQKTWHEFKREVDITIGRRDRVDEDEVLIPFIAIELKVGNNLNTAELDKKSSVYSSLKEIYPWVLNIFINKSNYSRGMKDESWLRNARQFNLVLTDWNKKTKTMLREAINYHLNYLVKYWKL